MMNYKYAKKEFKIKWNDDGKFECSELGIVKDTPDEVKAEIRSQTEKETALPRVSVLFLEDMNTKLVEATTNLKNVYSKYSMGDEIWVSWKSGGKSERAKKRVELIYPDTPEIRMLLNQCVEANQKANKMKSDARTVLSLIETVKAVKI
jgi:hypothetical protein